MDADTEGHHEPTTQLTRNRDPTFTAPTSQRAHFRAPELPTL